MAATALMSLYECSRSGMQVCVCLQAGLGDVGLVRWSIEQHTIAPDSDVDISARTRTGTLVAVRAVHTLIWLSVELSVAYLIIAGVTKRSGRSVAVAGAVVLGESVVYLANGARCPLTGVAESLGAESGSVTDIYLPGWFARRLPAIHVPIIALIVCLHRKRLLS